MNQRIRITAAESYVSISIENGATRETTGRDLLTVLAALPVEDARTVAAFCKGLAASLATRLEGAR